jgi:ABC-2 type transport system ATP-binding protein
MKVLQIDNLHKDYGKLTAVNQLNLSIEAGTVFGLLGPNGSGKSTTLGMILGVTNPTSGSFKWFGETGNNKHRKRIGAILEKPNFYPTFSAFKNLQIVCKIKEVSTDRIDEMLTLVGLIERKNDSFKTYSLGMKQRLAIAAALLADPDVLILDEPTNGLDPKGISEIRQLIIDIAQSGKTIILASHLLDEVQKVCTEFAILKRGNKIYQGKVEDGFGDEAIVEIASKDLETLQALLKNHPAFISERWLKDKIEVKFTLDTDMAELNQYCAERGVYLTHLSEIKKSLEQQFMEILSENA